MPTIRRSNRLTSNRKRNSVIEETKDKKEKEKLINPAEGNENILCAGCCREEPPKTVSTVKEITWLACDLCNKWWHCVCAGYTAEDAGKIISTEQPNIVTDSTTIRKELTKIKALEDQKEEAYSLLKGGIAIHLKDQKTRDRIIKSWPINTSIGKCLTNDVKEEKGGVAICINTHKTNFKATKYTDFEDTNYESVAATIHTDNNIIFSLLVPYIPPEETKQLEELTTKVQKVHQDNKHELVIIGDLNAKSLEWNNDKTNKAGK
ncbi:unnamed protein product [Mytilus coruscus]|uniref:Endonuclease/exonuclease/phosphatase domain-containing protein n=1 Tax=Mytilus coruscus TaxID=42192 RepID=A0A6J8CHL6_MYTCO|nr:unnamed protein product [Mytilus coruscus]